MKDTKYIVYKNEYGNDKAIVFTDDIVHSDMALRMRVKDKVVGAGFVSCHSLERSVELSSGMSRDVGFQSYGESVSLNIISRGELDDKAINEMFFGKDDLEDY